MRLFTTSIKSVIAVLALTFVCSVMADAQLAEAQRISGDKFNYTARTPRGVTVYSVSRQSPQVLTAIDKGLTDLFAVARHNGYSRLLNYSDYTIFIARADRTQDSQGQYSPDIAIGAAQYAGTVYDQGGYIFAAGMVLTNSPASFIIAEHTRDFQRISNVVRYEGEHLVLYYNDRQRYMQTRDHSKGGAHPILQ